MRGLLLDGFADEADSLAQRFAAKTEARYGPASLETAAALVLAVDAVLSTDNPSTMSLSRTTRVQARRVREAAERALAIRESRLGPDDARVGASLERLGRVEWALGEMEPARRHAERSLAVREKALGPDHPDLARSLHLLGGMLSDPEPAAALQLLDRALGIREAALGSDDIEVARTLSDLTYVSVVTREIKTAYLRRALRITESALGPRHFRVAVAMHDLAGYLLWRGEQQEATQLETSALEIAEAALGPLNPRLGGFYNLLGALCMGNDPQRAAPLLERALALRGENYAILSNLGDAYYNLGQNDRARDRFERAIADAAATRGPGSTWTAYMHTMYGVDLAFFEDAYLEAERHLRQATEISRRIPAPDDNTKRNWAWAIAGLAEVASRTGDSTRAGTLYRRAIGMLEGAVPTVYEPGSARSMYAGALLRAGDPAGAITQALRAQATLDTLLEPDDVVVTINLEIQAEARLALGQADAARQLLAQCLERRERSQGADHPSVATTLLAMAECDRRAGQLDSARVRLERAVTILDATFGPSNPQLAASLRLLGEVELARGDEAVALAAAVRAEDAGREHLRRTAEGLSERRALSYSGIRSTGLDCALAAAGVDPRPERVRAAWDAVLRSRGLVLDEMASRHRSLEATGDAVTDSAARALRLARGRLANLAVRGVGLGPAPGEAARTWNALPAEKLRALYRDAEEEKERLEEQLAVRSLVFRRGRERAAVNYERVAQALPADAALLAYVRYEPPRSPEGRYAAFVLRGGASPALVQLGRSAMVERAVDRWRTEVTRLAVDDSACREAGEALRRQVWDPVAPLLGGAERVFVVPEGVLSLLSFETLPVAGGRFLVESGPTVHYLSTERDLAFRDDDAPGAGLLAFGDPQFDGRPASGASVAGTYRGTFATCGDFRSARFEPLPATGAEVREVGRLWAGTGSESLLGADANEAAFKSRAPGHRVLHLATHGFFLGGKCRSALERTRGMGGLAVAEPPAREVGENPLLLSGLALAGANRREDAGPDEEDGILTAEEIASLDLSGVEWAVLSACETGVGEVRAGEGVFGLRRAFQVAGARTLIMSLWSVEDEATRAWMTQLYKARLEERLDTAESVRAASLAVLAERRAKGLSTHPFYWGAFVAAGDW